MKPHRTILIDLGISLGAALILGAVISALSPGSFVAGWIGLGSLVALLTFGCLRLWRTLSKTTTLAVLMLVTFILRIGLGIVFYKGLPVYGFNNPVQAAGYVFSDANDRDLAAYQIAVSDAAWLPQIKASAAVDQYGGLLAGSTLLYRVISPDSHRPLLIVLVSAFAMTLGVALLFSACQKQWGRKLALAAGWFYALYPDGILLGSSQMREPFLIGLACLLFWLILNWQSARLRSLLIGLAALLIMCLLSAPVAGAAAAILISILFFRWREGQPSKTIKGLSLVGYLVFLGLLGLAGWAWIGKGLSFEYYVAWHNSGIVQYLFKILPEPLKAPMITLYGLSQPLLPAAIVDPSKLIWRLLAIFRATGWYFAIPFMVYGLFACLSVKNEKEKSFLIIVSLSFAAWTLISSIRAGGDQWDNPRYRTIFLPWMSILFGWVWMRLRNGKRAWFWRILSIEILFVFGLLYWYINRFIKLPVQILLQHLFIAIAVLCVLIVVIGFLWDSAQKRHLLIK